MRVFGWKTVRYVVVEPFLSDTTNFSLFDTPCAQGWFVQGGVPPSDTPYVCSVHAGPLALLATPV